MCSRSEVEERSQYVSDEPAFLVHVADRVTLGHFQVSLPYFGCSSRSVDQYPPHTKWGLVKTLLILSWPSESIHLSVFLSWALGCRNRKTAT